MRFNNSNNQLQSNQFEEIHRSLKNDQYDSDNNQSPTFNENNFKNESKRIIINNTCVWVNLLIE